MDTLSFMRLERDFGSFDDWQRDFLACAAAARNGWVVTGLNLYTQKYMNFVIDSHNINVPMGVVPVIVLDVWQHAYYKDYMKDVKKYTINLMSELIWRVIEHRIDWADKMLLAFGGK